MYYNIIIRQKTSIGVYQRKNKQGGFVWGQHYINIIKICFTLTFAGIKMNLFFYSGFTLLF